MLSESWLKDRHPCFVKVHIRDKRESEEDDQDQESDDSDRQDVQDEDESEHESEHSCHDPSITYDVNIDLSAPEVVGH